MSDSAAPPQPLARTDFYREIRRNKARTALILLAFIVLIAVAGTAVDVLLGFAVVGAIVAVVIAAILASTLAVIAGGSVALLANIGLRFWILGGNRDEGDDGGIGIIVGIASITLLIFAPIAAQMMQFAMSRKRELLADAAGVQLTRYPPGLASALKKLQSDQAVIRHANHATAQLWIESPLDPHEDRKGSWLNPAFDTPPPPDARIQIP